MKKGFVILLFFIIVANSLIIAFAGGINGEGDRDTDASAGGWSTTNPFVVFENGTSTQVIQEKKHTTGYWYSTNSFEIYLLGTNQKITVPKETILQDSQDEGVVISTVFKTNWEKDVLPKFNLTGINGPTEFKIDAVIKMNGTNGLPGYCPSNGLYYDANRVKRANTGNKAEWDDRFNGIKKLLTNNINKILDFNNLTQENKNFINNFLSDLENRGLPRIILDFNFNDSMTDLALCMRYNIRAKFNAASTDYCTAIERTGVEGTTDGKANPNGSEIYTAIISYGVQDFKDAGDLVAPISITVENAEIVESVGAGKRSTNTAGGDITLTPSSLIQWNNTATDKTIAAVSGKPEINYKTAGNGALINIDDQSVPKRYVEIKWRPYGTAPVKIVTKINKNSSNSPIVSEDPSKLANNEKTVTIGLSGSDYSTVILRTGVESVEKLDKSQKYQGVIEYSISDYTGNAIIKPGIEVGITNGKIIAWGDTSKNVTQIEENIELTPSKLLEWQSNTNKQAVSIGVSGSNYSWIDSAFNQGRSDSSTIAGYIKAAHAPFKLVTDGKAEYFKTSSTLMKRYIYFTWQPNTDSERVLITSRIIPTGFDSNTTNNNFSAEVNNVISLQDTDVEPGKILFSPNDSSGCNKYGWSNKALDVIVHIDEGKESITISGVDNRTYWTRERICGQSEHSHSSSCYDENGILICGQTAHTHSDSCYKNFSHESPQMYTQVWNHEKIVAWGIEYPLIQDTYTNWGTITLKNNGIGSLTGEINNWLAGTKAWDPNGVLPQASWNTWWDSNDAPVDTKNPFTISGDYKYHSESGIYKIDIADPHTAGFLWDSQSVKGNRKDPSGDTCHEYMCSPDNTINVRFGDNLSGVIEARYLWSESKTQPLKDEMKPIYGLNTTEGKNETVDHAISLHDSQTAYWALRKGLWYLHVYQQDRAGNEIYTVSEPIYINKIGNFRINTIYDFDWKKYFRNVDNTFTKLSTDGIMVKDMPVYQNKEYCGIKLGYSTDMSLNTIGFDSSNSSLKISASFYGMDNTGALCPVKVFVPNKSGQFVNISSSSSEYYSLAKEITLDRRLMLTPDAAKPDYNTWPFNYFLPYNTRIAGVNDPDPVIKYDNRFTKLLVVFNIVGEKNYSATNTRTIKYTELENSWSLEDGSIYGKNLPSGHDLITDNTKPENPSFVNHGEVFWYDLTSTIMEDIRKGRKW